MTRVKRGKIATRKRERLLRYTKGFKWSRKTKERAAKEALLHAWAHAYRDRRRKKREFRKLWETQINAASRAYHLTYSQLIAGLKRAKIGLDRKALAEIAKNRPEVFEKIVTEIRRS